MIQYIGEPTMTLLKSIFGSVERFAGCAITGCLAFLAPISVSIIAAAGFMLVDGILGYRVYRKYQHLKQQKAHIESGKLWKSISKVMEAITVIIGAHILDTSIVTSIDMHAVEIAAGLICGTEMFSWLESMLELHPDSKMWNSIARLLRKIVKAKGEKYLDITIEDKDLPINIKENDSNISHSS